jgi:hypothetical protein
MFVCVLCKSSVHTPQLVAERLAMYEQHEHDKTNASTVCERTVCGERVHGRHELRERHQRVPIANTRLCVRRVVDVVGLFNE